MKRRLLTALPLLGLGQGPVHAVEPLTLVPGTPVDLVCTTSAMDLRTETLTTSEGAVRLQLSRAEVPSGDEKAPHHTWHVEADSRHASSFAAQKSCAPCTFTLDANRPLVTLWSPRPMGLPQNPDGETLLVVALDLKTLELKASQFRGKDLAGLERGTCTRAEAKPTAPTALPAPSAPPDPTPPSAPPKETEKP